MRATRFALAFLFASRIASAHDVATFSIAARDPLSAGKREESLQALQKALTLNPKLKKQASIDHDLDAVRNDPAFQKIVTQ